MALDGHEGVDDPQVGEPDRPAGLAIDVQNLKHEFRSRRSGLLHRPLLRRRVKTIDGISFSIAHGEVVGYVGPHGVGKTTLVKLVTGLLTPTHGTLRVYGLTPGTAAGPGAEQLSGKVGVVFGHRPQLWPDLSLAQSLRILASIHRLTERRWLTRRTELVERLRLAAFLDLPIGQLSPGRRIRSEVAAALLHEPELVVLDEPTLGLDARTKERLGAFLAQEHRLYGRTILITSSRLSDVEQLCNRLLLVDQGHLRYDGDLRNLIDRTDAHRVLVVDLTAADRLLDDVPGTRLFAVEAGGLRQRLSLPAGQTSTARVLADVVARTAIRNLALEEPPIEDLVRRLGPVA